jgi:hypothetical protein
MTMPTPLLLGLRLNLVLVRLFGIPIILATITITRRIARSFLFMVNTADLALFSVEMLIVDRVFVPDYPPRC